MTGEMMPDAIKNGMALRKYIQDDLRFDDFHFFFQVSFRFILDLAIWIDPEAYKKLPIFEPVAYRDQKWKKLGFVRGQANPSTALLVDDNSYVKNYMNGSTKFISSKKISYYNDKQLVSGSGFVACHIWDEVGHGKAKATGNHKLFSFIPNIVWLPQDVAYLTDIPGSPIKDILKQLSVNLYHGEKMANTDLQLIVDTSWEKLLEIPHNQLIPIKAIPNRDEYNLMKGFDSAIKNKISRHKVFAEALIEHGTGRPISPHLIKKTYVETMHLADPAKAHALGLWLEGYLNALP